MAFFKSSIFVVCLLLVLQVRGWPLCRTCYSRYYGSSHRAPDKGFPGLVVIDDDNPRSRQGLRVPLEDENAPSRQVALSNVHVPYTGFLQHAYGQQERALAKAQAAV
ncbi:uncharacterized protein LOC106171688 [Lingula anatina]|uniref:Uncharacterized protein LOC106171688 n=1 Tax=Lingula anatina TaxID=7574 RepID=A0A1S3JBM2_LINAN|nr:uncharacterized protein LOC106171688 [Lingula anatina]|eukprot:XP_013407586.1 uncharacterized protein LOC106171688 [Lingula anatina]